LGRVFGEASSLYTKMPSTNDIDQSNEVRTIAEAQLRVVVKITALYLLLVAVLIILRRYRSVKELLFSQPTLKQWA